MWVTTPRSPLVGGTIGQLGGIDIVRIATALVIGLLAIGLVARGIALLSEWQLLRSSGDGGTEPSTVRGGALDGSGSPAALEGSLRPASGTVEAPFTGTPCLAYTYSIEGEDVDVAVDRPGSGWNDLGSGSGGVECLLSGDDRTVLVDPDAVSLDFERSGETITVPSASDPPERVEEFLAATDGVPREGPPVEDPLEESTDRRRYHEAILEPGDRAFASGVLRARSAVDGVPPQAADAVLESPAGDGHLSRLRSVPAVLADRPLDAVASGRFKRGAGAIGVGLALAVAAVVVGWPA